MSSCSGRFDSTDKRQDDRAKAVYSNGDTYFGQYSNDRRQGVGLYLVATGGGYAGSYAGSKREGQGIMRMPDGALYQGQFAGDKFEGQGQYEYVDDSTYVGAWKGGKKHGEVNKASTCHAPGLQNMLCAAVSAACSQGTWCHKHIALLVLAARLAADTSSHTMTHMQSFVDWFVM